MITSPNQGGGLEFFLKKLWDKRASGEDVPEIDIDLFSTVTPENVMYLLNLYPFLQMISTEAEFTEEVITNFVTAKSGWIIHNYGEAMSSSLGDFLYTGGAYRPLPLVDRSILKEEGDEEGGEDGGDVQLNPGKGTVINQAFDTAVEMVEIARKNNWPGIHIVAGTPIMEWAAWLTADKYEMEISGYEPDRDSYNKQHRLQALSTRGVELQRKK